MFWCFRTRLYDVVLTSLLIGMIIQGQDVRNQRAFMCIFVSSYPGQVGSVSDKRSQVSKQVEVNPRINNPTHQPFGILHHPKVLNIVTQFPIYYIIFSAYLAALKKGCFLLAVVWVQTEPVVAHNGPHRQCERPTNERWPDFVWCKACREFSLTTPNLRHPKMRDEIRQFGSHHAMIPWDQPGSTTLWWTNSSQLKMAQSK